MKKSVPDPPILTVRQDLSPEEAMRHAADHMRNAVAIAQGFRVDDCRALTRGIVLQLHIANELVRVAVANSPHQRQR